MKFERRIDQAALFVMLLLGLGFGILAWRNPLWLVDKQVDVDLLSNDREFKIALDHVAEKPAAKPVATKRVTKQSAKPDDTTLEKPTATTPTPKEPIIDPTDTHDPFKHH